MEWKAVLPGVLTLALFCFSLSATEEVNSTTASTTPATTSSPATTTTVTPEQVCRRKSNKTCEDCVNGDDSQCYYCENNKQCYYFNTLMPGSEKCESLGKTKWATCKINMLFMIIGVSVVGGLLLVGTICCCCCCCRKRRKSIWSRDQVKWERQREELKMKSDDRRRERQSRTDEIRRKYGLMKTDNNYQRFDA